MDKVLVKLSDEAGVKLKKIVADKGITAGEVIDGLLGGTLAAEAKAEAKEAKDAEKAAAGPTHSHGVSHR